MNPAAAAVYEKQVKQFSENGGWLTVAGGVFATFGQDIIQIPQQFLFALDFCVFNHVHICCTAENRRKINIICLIKI